MPGLTVDAGLADLHAAAERIWLDAQAAWPALTVDVLPEVGSTNAHAMALGREAPAGPLVAVAWRQTSGRGRAGRSWDARPGDTLTFSLGLPLALMDVPGGGSALSLAVGVMVARALQRLPRRADGPVAPQVGLKWPNDLWVDGRKLGGILIEASQPAGLAAHQRWVVVGIGINLQGTTPDEAGQRTDLACHGWHRPGQAERPPTPGDVLQMLVPELLSGIATFEQQGFAAFRDAWQGMDVLAGQGVSLWRQGVSSLPPDARGTALGVDSQGALLIHDDMGQTRSWAVGDVSVRPLGHPL